MEKEFYVYGLYEIDNETPFYVGKDSGYRDRSHLKPHLWASPEKTNNPFLYSKIRKLMNEGTPPVIKRIVENVTEDEAYEIEHGLITKYGRRFVDEGKLFNISDSKGGNRKGMQLPLWSEERLFAHKEFWKNKRKYDPTYEELYNDYVTLGKTRETIAEENSVSVMLVKVRLKELGIKKPKTVRYPERSLNTCPNCGNTFETPNKTRRTYCSRKCYFEQRYE